MAVLMLTLHPFLSSSASAQSPPPSNTQTPPPKTQAPTAGKPATSPSKEATPLIITPSRFVGDADLDAYVADRCSVFSMRERVTDPFGQLQDPDAKPVIKTPAAKTTRRAPPVQATPFSDIIRLIKVTTVMPKEKCFLIGTRTIRQGNRLTLAHRGKNIRVEVISVNSQQIVFSNLDNSETASLKLNALPDGVTHGTRGITVRGMVPDRPDSPIDLDPGNPSNDKSQSR